MALPLKYTAAVIVVLLVAGVAAYLFLAPASASVGTPFVFGTATQTSTKRDIPGGWKEYQHSVRKFSVLYPDLFQVTERPEGRTLTTSFEVDGGGYGFQIYMVPYTESTISDAQFRRDVPSGVREQMSQTTVAGTEAVSFYSVAEIGDTFEVWFIKDGYLYEVTTYKELEPELRAILSTWLFL